MPVPRCAALFVVVLIALVAHPALGQPRPYAPDELLVAPKGGVSRAEAEALYRQHGAVLVEVLRGIDVHRITVPPQTLEAVGQALRQDPRVEFVERNGLLTLETTPNDALYPSQWHLPKISAPAAWDLTNGSANVTIAIVDTGVDPVHPDLADGLLAAPVLRALGGAHEGAQAAADDDVEAVGRVALAHERLAAGEARHLDLALQLAQRHLVERAEEGGAPQERRNGGSARAHDATTVCRAGRVVKARLSLG